MFFKRKTKKNTEPRFGLTLKIFEKKSKRGQRLFDIEAQSIGFIHTLTKIV